MTIHRSVRTTLAAAALPLLVAGLAACSSAGTDDVAAGDSLEKRARAWDASLASCMRDAGFDYDDGGQDGGISLDATAGDGWFEQFDACLTSTTDELGERPVTEAEKKAGEKAQAEFAEVEECLAEHGIELPDGDDGVAAAPEVPDDVAATCGWDELGTPTGGGASAD